MLCTTGMPRIKSISGMAEADKKLKDCLVGPATLEVEVEAGKFYALNYNVHEEYFEFLECDPENYMLD